MSIDMPCLVYEPLVRYSHSVFTALPLGQKKGTHFTVDSLCMVQ